MRKTYPFNSKLRNHLWIALGFTLWIFIFLYVAEPFDIYRFSEEEKLITLPIYALIQGICYSLPLFYQSLFYRKQKQWYYSNEIIFLTLLLTLGALLNGLFYKIIIVNNEPNTYSFFQYFKWIYLPAAAIILPVITFCRFILGKQTQLKQVNNKITIKGKGKYDFISLALEELLYIKSSDNYIEINFIQNNSIHKKLLRSTISEVEQTFPKLLKTHRSFLINSYHFKQFKTENKKLFAHLGFEQYIPISRNLQNEIKKELQVATNK